jgi:hypothetical protein
MTKICITCGTRHYKRSEICEEKEAAIQAYMHTHGVPRWIAIPNIHRDFLTKAYREIKRKGQSEKND